MRDFAASVCGKYPTCSQRGPPKRRTRSNRNCDWGNIILQTTSPFVVLQLMVLNMFIRYHIIVLFTPSLDDYSQMSPMLVCMSVDTSNQSSAPRVEVKEEVKQEVKEETTQESQVDTGRPLRRWILGKPSANIDHIWVFQLPKRCPLVHRFATSGIS